MSFQQAEQQVRYGWQQYLSNKRGKDLADSMKEFAKINRLIQSYHNPMHCLKVFARSKLPTGEDLNECLLIAKELSPINIGTKHHVIKLIERILSIKSIKLKKEEETTRRIDDDKYWTEEGDRVFNRWVGYAKNNGREDTLHNRTQQSNKETFPYFRIAAEKGYAKAQFILGVMYEQCCGTLRNYAKAEEWFLKAAQQELKEAQFYLGTIYENGRGSGREIDRGIGVQRNIERAIFWYERADAAGHLDANQSVARLKDTNIQPSDENPDPFDDINDKNEEFNALSETEKGALVKSRIGQGRFRDALIEYWGGKCAVTGIKVISLLKASHIKPWRDCNNKERLDKFNGLLLAPGLDSAFDKGFITFSEDGSIIISKILKEDDLKFLGIFPGSKLPELEKKHKEYLKYHQSYIFENWKIKDSSRCTMEPVQPRASDEQ